MQRVSSPFKLGLFLSIFCGHAAYGAELFRDEQFEVNVTENVQYGTGAVVGSSQGIPLVLDLYEPVGVTTEEALPAVVFVHGGAFMVGDKSEFGGPARRLAARGYVTVSIKYRLFGEDPDQEIFFDTTEEMVNDVIMLANADVFPFWPAGFFTEGEEGAANLDRILRSAAAAAEDSALAVSWVRENAADLGVDPDRIAIGGGSAGGIASLFAAYSDRFADIAPVRVVLDQCGALYGNEHYIEPGDAALFVMHGTADTIVPFSRAITLRDHARDRVSLEFHAIAGVGHCPVFSQVVDGMTLEQRFVDFFYEHLDLESVVHPGPSFVRGDTNADGNVDISDATFTLDWLFTGVAEPECLAALNANGDDAVDVADPVTVLNFLFSGGAPPAAPYPGCGRSDLEADSRLGCAAPTGCR